MNIVIASVVSFVVGAIVGAIALRVADGRQLDHVLRAGGFDVGLGRAEAIEMFKRAAARLPRKNDDRRN